MAFKTIYQRDEVELDEMIEKAKMMCINMGCDFYVILGGIDAYMEKRRRKNSAAVDREDAREEGGG